MSGVTSRPQATARRKPASERLAEIIEAAAAIAVAEGLDRVTAKRVAAELGVFPGLVSHYFATADELVATAFAHAAASEREQNFGLALLGRPPGRPDAAAARTSGCTRTATRSACSGWTRGRPAAGARPCWPRSDGR